MKHQPLAYARLAHYLSLALLVAGLSLGGWVTMGCSPKLTIPTGQLAAGQEGVIAGDEGGILFDAASTLQTATYELPSTVQYGRAMVAIDHWEAATSEQGDRVNGNTAVIANNLTSATRQRTATFVGFWFIPGQVAEERTITFQVRVGAF